MGTHETAFFRIVTYFQDREIAVVNQFRVFTRDNAENNYNGMKLVNRRSAMSTYIKEIL
jgi:hypothetical protein